MITQDKIAKQHQAERARLKIFEDGMRPDGDDIEDSENGETELPHSSFLERAHLTTTLQSAEQKAKVDAKKLQREGSGKKSDMDDMDMDTDLDDDKDDDNKDDDDDDDAGRVHVHVVHVAL